MDPLVNLAMFRDRAFAVDTLVLLSASIVFVPVFFFASEYGQISLGQTPSQASLLLLYFFAGFVVAAQFGGRMLDRIGARRPVVLGAILAAVGLNLWAGHVTSLSVGSQVTFIVMTGAGMGLLLGQANTDALNHAPRDSYGEAIGVTQTIRNLGASLGLAATGTVLVTQLHANVQESLTERGLPAGQAHLLADHIAQLSDHRLAATIPQFVRADFASATGSALTLLSWVMAATAVIAFVGLPRRAPARHMSDPLAVDETARELVVAGGS